MESKIRCRSSNIAHAREPIIEMHDIISDNRQHTTATMMEAKRPCLAPFKALKQLIESDGYDNYSEKEFHWSFIACCSVKPAQNKSRALSLMVVDRAIFRQTA